MSNRDAFRNMNIAKACNKAHATVPEIAERFLEDNPDFSAGLRFEIRSAANSSTSTEEFWKKVEVAMKNCR